MLSLNTTNRVTFNVNVFGTASTPTVRCILGEAPGLSFPAVKRSDGQFEVVIDLPMGTKPGGHPFKVEVLLNGRLFTPIQTTIAIAGDEPVAPVMPSPSITAPVKTAPRIDAEVTPRQQLPEEPVKPVQSLMKAFTAADEPVKVPAPKPKRVKEAAAPAPTPAAPIELPVPPPAVFKALATEAKKPAKSLKRRAVQAPAPEIKSIKISMASIAEAAEAIEPVRQTQHQIRITPVKESSSIPVALVKGDIIYL